jgi:hypothetical protein
MRSAIPMRSWTLISIARMGSRCETAMTTKRMARMKYGVIFAVEDEASTLDIEDEGDLLHSQEEYEGR